MLARVLRRCLGAGLLVGLLAQPAAAQPGDPPATTDTRIAFVAGNARYEQGSVANALNDAGLVAEALRSIGFEIVEGADLTQSDFIRTYRDFLDKVTEAGENTVAFVYFSGLGFEYEGDNYLVLGDARIQRPSDLTLGTVRLADLIRPLAGTPARAKIMAIDATRPLPFTIQGRRMARGLGAVEAEPTMLIGFSAAPGTLSEDRPGDYGPYAMAIAEMIRAPGLDINAVFTQIRVRTHQATEGKQTPFHVTAIQDTTPLVPAEAPSDTGQPPQAPRIVGDDRPLRDVGPTDAYARTIERDTLAGYDEFAKTYPNSPYTQRIRATARARREAMLWLRALEANTPEGYWTYLRRYPNGMYAADALYRLRRLQAAAEPPVEFVPVDVEDVPLPPPEEPLDLAALLPDAPPPPEDLIAAPAPLFAALPAALVAVDGGRLRGPGRIPRLREPRRPRVDRDRRQPRQPGLDRRQPRPPLVDRRQPRLPGADRDRRQPRPPLVDRRQRQQPGVDRRQRQQPGVDRRQRQQPGVDRRQRQQPGVDRRQRQQPGVDRRQRQQPGVDRRQRQQPGVDRRQRQQPRVDRRQPRQQRIQQRAQPRVQQRQQRIQPRVQQRQPRIQQRAQPRVQQRAQPRIQQRAQPRMQQPRMQQRAAPRPQVQRPAPRPQPQRRR
jgi:uncharacterized caspase-like protein